MPDAAEAVDLRDEPERLITLAALCEVRELGPGEARRLLTRDDPALLMARLNLQLRDALAWETTPVEGHWETMVRLAADVAPRDVIEMLVRDHRRLDQLLGRALRRLNAGDLATARSMLEEFAAGLRRHARAEDSLIVSTLGPAPRPESLDSMAREHAELLDQLAALEGSFNSGETQQAWEIEPFAALLSGTLAKHEQREEQAVFPLWRTSLAARGQASGDALLEQVRAALLDQA
ncbi:MAG: hemerythrin domain-containing protein [Betaproteobacteria bacterium]|nr:hemerythrin domain-containing protein [Betaproteobacteria bacterium]